MAQGSDHVLWPTSQVTLLIWFAAYQEAVSRQEQVQLSLHLTDAIQYDKSSYTTVHCIHRAHSSRMPGRHQESHNETLLTTATNMPGMLTVNSALMQQIEPWHSLKSVLTAECSWNVLLTRKEKKKKKFTHTHARGKLFASTLLYQGCTSML